MNGRGRHRSRLCVQVRQLRFFGFFFSLFSLVFVFASGVHVKERFHGRLQDEYRIWVGQRFEYGQA